MTDSPDKNSMSDWDMAVTRIAVLVLSTMQAFFPAYAIHHALKRADPKGGGMEWLGAAPMLLVFIFFGLPALISGLRGTKLKRALLLVLIAALLNAVFYLAILWQFAG